MRLLPGLAVLLLLVPAPGWAQSLSGSPRSLDAQNRVARQHDFTYLATPAQVRRFVSAGFLVPVTGGSAFELSGVSFPYARPELRLFLERLGRQYRAACGERLVVTSLTRPATRQPRNASSRSVHPTGMAADLRKSRNPRCRAWLERVLLDLERGGVLEATRERHPPHYHVAVFPRQYSQYVNGRRTTLVAQADVRHRVQRGESLWAIARRYGSSVDAIRDANRLASTRIRPGQTLLVPSAGGDS